MRPVWVCAESFRQRVSSQSFSAAKEGKLALAARADGEHPGRSSRSALSPPGGRVSKRLARGLLSFPVTFFDAEGAFNEDGYRAHVAAQSRGGVSGLFAAGGTGEFFSLPSIKIHRARGKRRRERNARGRAAARGRRLRDRDGDRFREGGGSSGGAGNSRSAALPRSCQSGGLQRHLIAICQACGLGVIAYNRDNSVLTPDSVARVAEKCPNLIGFKDGVGNIETLTLLRAKVGVSSHSRGGDADGRGSRERGAGRRHDDLLLSYLQFRAENSAGFL